MIKNIQSMGNGGDNVDLTQDILSALPSDPFELLDVARRITSMAMAARVTKIENDEKKMVQKVAEKDKTISEQRDRLFEIERSLEETTARLNHALDEQVKLTNEKSVLLATIKRLNREVTKLDAFKRSLMQSLQDDDENSQVDGGDKLSFLHTRSFKKSSAASDGGASSFKSYTIDGSETDCHVETDALRHGIYHRYTNSRTQIPPISPTIGSPAAKSAAGSPGPLSGSGSPNRRTMSEIRAPIHLSLPASETSTAPNSPPSAGALPVHGNKVDGKEFFRKARNRLSYEQFKEFLANIKELNSHRRSREETLKIADDIFGPNNKDLYSVFVGLLSRHL
ncbi:hypothetical protein O6H91_10G074600 [Diphasiastrum complanatum]|uniref:Uncharacterized protein n=1 Tax=Diphasiastrum complanatum TaxID=34168 RepID=A0ACC2CI89_DIPCM|nr:hypothetical protein O6H91_10G074600 [Diphasiastrum complanatum]